MRSLFAVRLGALFAGALLAGCAAEPPRTARTAAARCGQLTEQIAPATAQAWEIDALLERYVQYGYSGTVLLRQAGAPVLHKGYGWAEAEMRVPNGPATLFDVASVAKTFTAAAILDLEARGRLSTADPLSKYLPGLTPEKQSITLHHLLTHTAGYPLDAGDIGVTGEASVDEMLARAASARLLHEPGARYEYSNIGYGLLALVIEKVSGRTWQQYVRDRLLKRAGLKNSMLFGEDVPRRLQLAQGYSGPSDEEAARQPPMTASARNRLMWGKHPLGAVGVFATVGDLDRWWCALNGTKLLPPAQRSKLFTVQAANQGYGWNINQADGRVARIYRGGLRGSFQALVAHYPERRDLLVYAINKNVANAQWAGLTWGRIERILAGQAVELPPALSAPDADAVERVAGEYRLGNGGKLVFRRKGAVLFFGAEGQDALDPLEYGERPKPEGREKLHSASLELVRAFARSDLATAGRIGGLDATNAARLNGQWKQWEQRIGAWRGAQLLGSTPGAENHLRVFLRLQGTGGALVVRLLWDRGKQAVLAWGDDIPLPAYVRLWPQGDNDFVSHDLATGRTRYFRFRDERVTISTNGEDVLVSGSRTR
jgi:CubicO group peptidase (beta-lactamase class C family)